MLQSLAHGRLQMLLVAGLMLGGCQTVGSGDAPTTALAVGALSGEACRTAPQRGQPQILEVFCGNGTRALGSAQALAELRSSPSDVAARREFFAKAFADSALMRGLGLRAACKPAEWVGPGADLLVAACTLKDGGWPYVAAALPDDKRLAVGDGLPGALPALIGAMRATLGSSETAGAEARDAGVGNVDRVVGRAGPAPRGRRVQGEEDLLDQRGRFAQQGLGWTLGGRGLGRGARGLVSHDVVSARHAQVLGLARHVPHNLPRSTMSANATTASGHQM
jgi:hypothetical protein